MYNSHLCPRAKKNITNKKNYHGRHTLWSYWDDDVSNNLGDCDEELLSMSWSCSEFSSTWDELDSLTLKFIFGWLSVLSLLLFVLCAFSFVKLERLDDDDDDVDEEELMGDTDERRKLLRVFGLLDDGLLSDKQLWVWVGDEGVDESFEGIVWLKLTGDEIWLLKFSGVKFGLSDGEWWLRLLWSWYCCGSVLIDLDIKCWSRDMFSANCPWVLIWDGKLVAWRDGEGDDGEEILLLLGEVVFIEFIDWNCRIRFEIKRCRVDWSIELFWWAPITVAAAAVAGDRQPVIPCAPITGDDGDAGIVCVLLLTKRMHSWTHSL